ncbi:MAG TPA: phosphatidate cytidylyltransferase [Thermoanaerobaculia bacterium]|nr:phosphatidate cytidylyltransferase [Thermoanaerobaculia bacterium]
MKRILTAAIGVPLALAANFLLPEWGFFLMMLAVLAGCTVEYLRIARPRAPQAPLAALHLLVPAVAVGLWLVASGRIAPSPFYLLVLAAILAPGVSTILLLGRAPLDQTLPALGIMAFGVPYLALPTVAFARLQAIDPWLTFLLVAIVWLGDTAAFYVGSRWGRRKLAPVVSPKKTWEGAAAGLLTGVLATAVWSVCQLGALDPRVLALGALTAVAGQLGDLVESMLKREAGVKDSGGLLPGHGGILDRMDATLFAAPVLLIGAWLLGFDAVVHPSVLR